MCIKLKSGSRSLEGIKVLSGLAKAFTIVLFVLIYRGVKQLRRKRLQKKAEINDCWVCEHCLVENPNDQDVCHYCGKKRFESEMIIDTQSVDSEQGESMNDEKKCLKCELCGKETEELKNAMIKDEMGIRYRDVCNDCYLKYDAKKK